MKNRIIDKVLSRAVGTFFLLAGAFFVCSTILSMRAVFADPVAGYDQTAVMNQSSQMASPRSAAQSPRTGANRAGATAQSGRTTAAASRGVATRASGASSVAARSVAARNNATTARTARNVISRVGVSSGQNVGASSSRVSLTGNAIRASTGSYNSGLSTKLYTGTYSNIVDPTTGLISADAYANCLESYYACMDEICTARNAAQRRCACAYRVKTFTNVESQLQQAKEDLLNVSGQLSLLIASKGKDISVAFQLTDAEKVLNCVSYRDASKNGTLVEWCQNHTTLTGTLPDNCGATISAPTYCTDNAFGWGTGTAWMDALNGADSDILAGLQTYASTIDQINVVTTDSNNDLINSYLNVNNVVNSMSGTNAIFTADATVDTLANTWGYELFGYAHNNVCGRVLDSCFNGIYETCGSNNGTSGPYNYNSKVTVSSNGGEVTLTDAKTSTSTATCYGYTTSSGDPYSSLRKPVADSRRSIVQKYLLDANADCDLYGEELKKQATNMAYQKIAATQLLQNKRLEFQQEENTAIATNYAAARDNFYKCLSELYDCYTTQETSNTAWSTSRIKTYCAQSVNAPSCYDTMICVPNGAPLAAVVDVADTIGACLYSTDIKTNTCRNIVTLAEILSTVAGSTPGGNNSASLREACLQEVGIEGVRTWTRTASDGTGW